MAEKIKNMLKVIAKMNETLANAIRRSANEIPILAIDEVEFHKNDSALYDEIIAHRLGLIPLKTERKLNEVEKCSCEGKGCNKCQINVSLKAKGPCTVYAKDLKGDVSVIYEKIPIVILEKDQEIQFVAFARLGKAINHAKFSPGLLYYRNISEITIKNPEDAEKIIEKLSNNLLNPQKGKLKSGEVYKCDKDIDYIETFIEKNDKNPGIEVKPGEEIVFFVESWGQLDAKEIFSEAIESLNKNFKEVLKTIKK